MPRLIGLAAIVSGAAQKIAEHDETKVEQQQNRGQGISQRHSPDEDKDHDDIEESA